MSTEITDSIAIQSLLDKIAGIDHEQGNPRLKQVVRRLVEDFFAAIEDLNITEDEFWHSLHFLQRAAPEFSLIAPGLGFDHFLDVLLDEADRKAGKIPGTPRTIEGPLYVEGAPLSESSADMYDGEGPMMKLNGVIRDEKGTPVQGALVDIWHASKNGGYSHFDPSLPEFAYRRRIRTASDGSYEVTSVLPSGYSVPEQGCSEQLLDGLGRHGSRPAHIHFFVSAEGHRHLTTQINIAGDPFLHDDFAFATRDELIVERDEGEGTEESPVILSFDLVLPKADSEEDSQRSMRQRTSA